MNTNQTWIRDQLVDHGRKLFDAPRELVRFTKNDEADALLNGLERFPHAFVLACIMDRQVKAERAWLIPHRFRQKLDGDFSIGRLGALSVSDVQELMSKPEPLHRFMDNMSACFHAAVHRIVDHYEGDASRIWRGSPSSAEVVYRFLEFEGVGPKIASMAANGLARELKLPFADYYSIDVSADVHVRRVFGRLGLTGPNPTVEQCIYRARALSPEFPGLMDLPAWEVGRSWCRPTNPRCPSCYMRDACPTANTGNE
jgi:endonuclease III